MDNSAENYLKNIRKLFGHYKSLGDKAIAQLNEEAFHWQFNPQSNSIAIIVKHVAGNSLSRWTDFLISDGEKLWRNRDAEFEDTGSSQKEIMALWEKGWQCLYNAIDPLSVDDLTRLLYIRGEAHTVTEALNRHLAHLAYHVGQIVTIAKMKSNENWQSLSIPKGESKAYSSVKFPPASNGNS